MRESDKLVVLCNTLRKLGRGVSISLIPSDDPKTENWSVVGSIGSTSAGSAGGVVLFNTDFVPLDAALNQALVRIASISGSMLAVVKDSIPPPEK